MKLFKPYLDMKRTNMKKPDSKREYEQKIQVQRNMRHINYS